MTELRITTGTAKNKRLKTPEIEGFRAVQEVAKSAVFSIIGEEIIDAKCLDLFAGSGNMGLEALSRGAATCDFVDAARESIDAIKENIRNCGFEDRATVHWKEAVKYVKTCEKKYDLIFMDPFYDDTKQTFLLTNLERLAEKKAFLVIFNKVGIDLTDFAKFKSWSTISRRKFGMSQVRILSSLYTNLPNK
jgi:16S rRNA (guanine(966)-N(2))-methyltransferase RsmD